MFILQHVNIYFIKLWYAIYYRHIDVSFILRGTLISFRVRRYDEKYILKIVLLSSLKRGSPSSGRVV